MDGVDEVTGKDLWRFLKLQELIGIILQGKVGGCGEAAHLKAFILDGRLDMTGDLCD